MSRAASTVGSNDCEYDVPTASRSVFENGILNNPLIANSLPKEALECRKSIRFSGSPSPSIPINWRFAESISALKALEATLVNVLLKRKYNVTPQSVEINTDHATLFILSATVNVIDPKGENIKFPEGVIKSLKYFPSWDKHSTGYSIHRHLATNIYPTKDGRYYHIHGSMNPEPTLTSLGLPTDQDYASVQEGKLAFRQAMSKFTAEEYDKIANEEYRQSGVKCHSIDEFKATEHGQANAHVGLFEVHHQPTAHAPCWWPDSPQTSAERPLAGLKVVDLTRVIAGPAISRGLAELGASVMRIVGPDVADMHNLHMDLNHGKWNACLDLKKEEDCETLRGLIKDADVFLQGYRPFVLDKYGFGKDDILKMVEGRDRGIIYARENCYGWYGPWAGRSGWQQISDAVCGVSLEFGRAMGHDEPVTPAFPNSDYCTGICGVAGILVALMQRAEKGGNIVVDLALNYYSQWLVDSVGTYPEQVWQELWAKHGKQVFRCDDGMALALLASYVQMLLENSSDVLFRPEFMMDIFQRNLGVDVRIVKPVLQYPGGEVTLGYNVGTRTNGVDQPRWPDDLMTEIVT